MSPDFSLSFVFVLKILLIKTSFFPDLAMEVESDQNQQAGATKYLVKAIIRNKLIFKSRPKPIIANVPKKI